MDLVELILLILLNLFKGDIMKKVFIFGYDSNCELIYTTMEAKEFDKALNKALDKIEEFRGGNDKGYVASTQQAALSSLLGASADESKICGREFFETDEELSDLIEKYR